LFIYIKLSGDVYTCAQWTVKWKIQIAVLYVTGETATNERHKKTTSHNVQ